jgi:hypothetical protein
MAPFDLGVDGEIHFATCYNRVDDRPVYDTVEQIEGVCCRGFGAKYVSLASGRDGKQRIRASCGCGQAHFIRWLSMIEEHRALLNKPEDWHKSFRNW